MKLLQKHPVLIAILLATVAVFFYSYWANIYRPGAMIEGGWYSAWADQRRYYEEAQAIVNFNLNAENFHYPILYPLLGAFFIKFFPRDPFFFINLSLFATTAGLLYLLVEHIFDKQKAIFAAILLLSTERFIYDFVTPWTTSLTTPLFLASLYILLTKRYTVKYLTIISGLASLAFLARSTDAIFFVPIILGFVLKNSKIKSKELLKRILLATTILISVVIPMMLINFVIAGSILGPYTQRIITQFEVKLSPLTLLEKIIGYFGNSFVFHRQIEFFSLPVLQTLPLLLLLIIFIPMIDSQIVKKHKIIHISILISFVVWLIIYLPYGAIAPYTLKNLSIHYIKLWYPVGIFYMLYAIEGMSKKTLTKKVAMAILPLGLILLLIPLFIQKTQPRSLSKVGWSTESIVNERQVISVIDSDDETAWSTLKPRQKGNELIIDMKQMHFVSRLQLRDGKEGTATNFDTSISEDKKIWKRLARNYTYNVRRDYGWDVVGYMQKGRYVKLNLNETSKTDPWIIYEITMFGY